MQSEVLDEMYMWTEASYISSDAQTKNTRSLEPAFENRVTQSLPSLESVIRGPEATSRKCSEATMLKLNIVTINGTLLHTMAESRAEDEMVPITRHSKA